MKKIQILLDIGGTQIKGSCMDSKGNLDEPLLVLPAHASESSGIIFDTIAGLIRNILSRHPDSCPERIGFAFPGPFDYSRGISLMRGQNKYDSIYGLSVAEEITKRIPELKNVPFFFLHDIESFALGESSFGYGKNADRILCLCIGTGTGSAFVKNKVCLKNEEDGAPKDGWIYNLPYKDALIDDYISVRGLERISSRIFGKALNGKELWELCMRNDPDALRVYQLFGEDLTEAVLPFVDRFRPDAIIMAGQISKSFSFFGGSFRKECDARRIQIYTEPETSVRAMQGLYTYIMQEDAR